MRVSVILRQRYRVIVRIRCLRYSAPLMTFNQKQPLRLLSSVDRRRALRSVNNLGSVHGAVLLPFDPDIALSAL